MWTSADGEAWDEQPVALGIENVMLIGIAPRADGRLLLVGKVPGAGAMPDQPAAATVAWVSDDTVTWQAIDLPLPEHAVVDSFDHGPKGYALYGRRRDLVLGGRHGLDDDVRAEPPAWWQGMMASSHWLFRRLPVPAMSWRRAMGRAGISRAESPPLCSMWRRWAGDWVATGYSGDSTTITVWHSTNGLDWTPGIDVNDLTGPDGPKTGRGLNEAAINGASLAGGAGYGFLTLTNNHCCAQMSWNYGVWGSADGTAFTPVVDGDAFVSSVASNGVRDRPRWAPRTWG